MTRTSTRVFQASIIAFLGLLFVPSIASASLLYQQHSVGSFYDVAYSFPKYAGGYVFTATATGTISSIDMILTKVSAGSSGCARGVIYSTSGGIPDLEMAQSSNCIDHDDIAIKPLTSTTTYIFPFTKIYTGVQYFIGIEWDGAVPLSGDNVQTPVSGSNVYDGYVCGLFGSWACNTGTPINDMYFNIWGYQGIVYDATTSSAVECDTFDVGCYFAVAISFAFTLPDGAFDQFITLKDDLKDHAPFGYFTSAINALGSFSTTTGSSTTLAIPAPIQITIFDPLRLAIVTIVFCAGLFWLYKRVKNIHI